MSDHKNHLYLSWDQFHKDVRSLSEKLNPLHTIHTLIAITRGGLFPAGIIARELGIRVIDTLCLASYDHQNQNSLEVLKPISHEILQRIGQGEGVLVIDDLVDTGATARFIKDLLPNCTLATVYAKPKGQHIPDFYEKEVPQETWVFFPWDTDFKYIPPLRQGAIA
jgi:xanthine phosphoribosyltransferase